jgi:hypothetical protein
MPPPYVKTVEDVIYYYYAKLVVAPSANLKGNFGFIIHTFKKLKNGEMTISDYDREIELKELATEKKCIYCGSESSLTQDHVIPHEIGGPDGRHNIVWCCKTCNSSKGSKDLIEWWNETFAESIGKAEEDLPRLPAGIYLKFSHDWAKINNLLHNPARSLKDLKPFVSRKRSKSK